MADNKMCPNCGSSDVNTFCSQCGQKMHHERFTLKSFIMDLLSVFNFETGFLYTAKMLFIHPGQVANDYLKGRTRPYVNPLKYLVIIAGVYAFLILYLKIYDASLETFSMPLADAPADATSTEAVRLQQQWLNFYRQILNFIPLILIPFFSITTRWFTRSRDLYYGEHLVINSFLFGQTFLIIVLLTPLAVIFPSLIGYFPFFAFIVYIAYMGYFFHGTYGYPPLKSFFKAFFSLLTGYLIFVLFMIVIMILLFVFIFIKNNPVL